MKNIITIVFTLLVANFINAQGIEFFHGTLKEAQAKAKAEEKLIFIDCFAKWCGPCKRMASEVFTKEDVGKFFNANYVPMKIDMEEEGGGEIQDKYPVSAYPTFLIVNEKGELITKQVGGMSPADFIGFGKKALGKNDYSAEYEKEYKAGNRKADFLAKYTKSLNKSSKSSVKVINEFIATKPDLKDTSNLKVIIEGLYESDSKCFDLFVQNKKTIRQFIQEDTYLSKIETACQRTVDKAIKFKSTDLLKEAVLKMKANCSKTAQEFEISNGMSFYNSMGDATAYCKTCHDYVSKVINKDANKINALALQIVEKFALDKNAMNDAEKFAKLAADMSKDSIAEKTKKIAEIKNQELVPAINDLILKIKQS
jgi:thiol-disulfide isomerase/thioredoxin